MAATLRLIILSAAHFFVFQAKRMSPRKATRVFLGFLGGRHPDGAQAFESTGTRAGTQGRTGLPLGRGGMPNAPVLS